jgi:UDP-glucuronate 4-epimerase
MTILVTGAAGFIGSHVSEALLRRGDQVIGLDNFNAFYDPAIKRNNAQELKALAGFTLIEGDITDEICLEKIFSAYQIDVIIHLAAWAGVRPSIVTPAIYVDVNIRGTLNLLEKARIQNIKKFVFASSSSVYGGRTDAPFRETDSVDQPISPYAATKKAGEVLAYTYHHLYGMDIAALRFFTVYGPRQRPEMAIHKFATMLVRGEEIPLYGDGSTARDYTYIDDIVQGILAALDRHQGYGIYNLGESQTTRLDDLIQMLGKALAITPKLRHEPEQPGDVPLTFADISSAREKLGYDPRVSIQEGIERFATWFKVHGVH